MSTIRKVGLLGAGYISESHAEALLATENVEITAVCDSSLGRASKLANQFNIPHSFDSLDEMLKLNLDAIHVLVPPDYHISESRKIIESGVNVFLEKPMGVDSKSCYELAELAKKNNVKLGVNHNFLFLPAYEKLYEDCKSGLLGKTDQITIHWFSMLGFLKFGPYDIWMLEEPKNLLFELGSHTTAFLLDLLGTPDHVETVVTRPIEMPGNKIAYRRMQTLAFKDEQAADINISLIPGFTDKSISVRGTAGTGKCDYERNIYYKDTPSRYSMLWNNYVSAKGMAKEITRNSFKNLIASVLATLKKSPGSTPFGLSIERSVAAFYKTLGDDKLDRRLDGFFGAAVIEWCEKMADKADFDIKLKDEKVWSTLPPINKPSILVIGGTGFIGKHLVSKLTQRGYSVRVITRNMSAGNIALAGLPVELVQGSLVDPEFLDVALKGIDIVYHLAKTEGKKWDDYYKNDVLVTKNIAERAQAAGVNRFIYTGTIDSYYSANKNQTITCETPLDKNIKHRNLYARSKAMCEKLLFDMYLESGFPVTVMRPGVVIGKGCPPAHWGVGMWQSDNVVQFWGDGTNKLPLVLVGDVAEGLVLAMETDIDKVAGKAFNLIDEPFISAVEYAEIVTEESGIKIKTIPTPIWRHFITDALKNAAKFAVKHPNRLMPSYRDWDSRAHRSYYDCSITRDILGWEPVASKDKIISDGIKASVEEMSS